MLQSLTVPNATGEVFTIELALPDPSDEGTSIGLSRFFWVNICFIKGLLRVELIQVSRVVGTEGVAVMGKSHSHNYDHDSESLKSLTHDSF